jgi:Gp49-like protein DUF891
MSTTAAKGAWGTVEWARTANGQEPARDFFLTLDTADQAKLLDLFNRLAETGRIPNSDRFKSLGPTGAGLFEFRIFQVRFLGDFRPGKRFVVASGLRKKRDKLDRGDIQVAARIMQENDTGSR